MQQEHGDTIMADNIPNLDMENIINPYQYTTDFTIRDFVTVGIFAAVIKAVTLVIAFLGGGMNPLTLIIKNFIYTALMLVLLHKIAKPWTLPLAVIIGAFVSLLLMGQGITQAPLTILASLFAEGIIRISGGYKRSLALVLGVLLLELGSKSLAIAMSAISMREQPGMIMMPVIFISIGFLGTIAGLFGGTRFVKELRHASIISK